MTRAIVEQQMGSFTVIGKRRTEFNMVPCGKITILIDIRGDA